LAVLAAHPFYERRWSPTVTDIVNSFFDVVVTAFYPECFSSAALGFRGLVVARAFGREGGKTYADLIASWGVPELEPRLVEMGKRYVFGQAYSELAEVEPPPHRTRAVTLPLPLPGWVAGREGSWHGGDRRLLFNCPIMNDASYYASYHQAIYAGIKENFGDLRHAIFGRHQGAVDDPAVIRCPSDAEVLDLFAGAAAFVYTSPEARHLHYAPIEAAIVGAPVLYRRGALLDRLVGEALPGACADLDEMRCKARALLDGDAVLGELIRGSQAALLSSFGRAAACAAWSGLLVAGAAEAA
jgi:hypothetical protein